MTSPTTPRALEVLETIAKAIVAGNDPTPPGIAQELDLAVATVKHHIARARVDYGVPAGPGSTMSTVVLAVMRGDIATPS